MSFTQIFSALSYGGVVYLLRRHLRGDAHAITEIIRSEGISLTCATPSEYFSWLAYGDLPSLRDSSWSRAICAGEPVTERLPRSAGCSSKPALRFFNSYGPTEISLVATAMEILYTPENRSGMLPIGAGIVLPNYSVYVLDANLKPVPPGIQGEIYVGGAGVASGYLNNHQLTDERFVSDVLAAPEYISKGWTIMHRTGDLGRWRADGAILVEGRISGDTQIKLRRSSH